MGANVIMREYKRKESIKKEELIDVNMEQITIEVFRYYPGTT